MKVSIDIVSTKKELVSAIKSLSKMPYLVLDFETSNLEPKNIGSKILSIAVGNSEKTFSIPVEHKENTYLKGVVSSGILEEINKKPIVAHNFKFEKRWGFLYGMNLQLKFDTMVAHHLLNENSGHALDVLVDTYVPELSGYWKEVDRHLVGKDYETVPLNILLNYNAYDVISTDIIYKILDKELDKFPKLKKIYYTYYQEVINAVAVMEDNGFTVDKTRLYELKNQYETISCDNEKEVIKILGTSRLNSIPGEVKKNAKEGEEFNFNSNNQLQYLLYKVMNLPILKKTKINHKTGGGGNPSADESTLTMLLNSNIKPKYKDVLKALLKRTKANTQLKSFINVFIDKLNVSSDGNIRTNYNMHVVETHRLSSSNPNLQNITTNEKLKEFNLPPIKEIFVSRFKNGKIIQADYSQIELRITAMYTGDKVFTKAFNEERDLHGELAEKVWGKNYDKAQRTKAKRTNFSAIFYITPEALSEEHKIPINECVKLLNTFRTIHPEIYAFFEQIWEDTQELGYIENFVGLRRRVADELSVASNEWELESIKRQICNFPIQSTVPFFMLTGISLLIKYIVKNKMKSVVFGSVHDSVYIDCYPTEVEKLKKVIKQIFEDEITKLYKTFISVPIKIDITVGNNLYDLK